MSAVVIRLKTKNHKHFGRVEAVTAMHRRWIPGPELELHQDLGGKVLQVDVPSWNKWVSNKEPVGTNRMNGPLK